MTDLRELLREAHPHLLGYMDLYERIRVALAQQPEPAIAWPFASDPPPSAAALIAEKDAEIEWLKAEWLHERLNYDQSLVNAATEERYNLVRKRAEAASAALARAKAQASVARVAQPCAKHRFSSIAFTTTAMTAIPYCPGCEEEQQASQHERGA
jgi:hypothetical protein